MLVVGIDPGAKGAMVAMDEHGHVEISPLTENFAIHVAEFVVARAYFFIESVTASPQMGVVSAFTFGKEYGRLLGVLDTIVKEYVKVKPQLWQGRLSLSFPGQAIDYREKKKRCYEAAKKMFPNVKVTRDNADAILIAEYGRRVTHE